MIIGIDGHRLFRRRKHGMEIVTIELIKNLQSIDTKNQYYIFVESGIDKTCIHETTNFKIIKIKVGSFSIWEQLALPLAAKKCRCELLHCTSNTAPLFTKIPMIVTIHDMIYLEKSYYGIMNNYGTKYQRFGNIYRRFIVPRIAKSAQKIITVSHSEKQRINDFFHFPKEKEKVISIYNGVSVHFKKIDNSLELMRTKEKYKLPDNFMLFLGNTDPKKNTTNVLKAFFEFQRIYQGDIKLVVVDYQPEQLKKQMVEIGQKEPIDSIFLPGYVVNEDLPAIYSLSKLFLYPSLRESFGIPILEAMKCGVPVITSNTSSMPEVSGGNAILIDPFKPEEITNAMLQLVDNQSIRNDLIHRGYQQAERFTWERMARNVLEIYNQVGNGL